MVSRGMSCGQLVDCPLTVLGTWSVVACPTPSLPQDLHRVRQMPLLQLPLRIVVIQEVSNLREIILSVRGPSHLYGGRVSQQLLRSTIVLECRRCSHLLLLPEEDSVQVLGQVPVCHVWRAGFRGAGQLYFPNNRWSSFLLMMLSARLLCLCV